MFHKNKNAPKDYFSLHLKVLRLVGVNIFHIENPFFKTLYNIYAVAFGVFSYFLVTCFEFISLMQNITNWDILSFILCFWMTHVMGCLKMFIFLKNKKKIRRYLKSFEEGFFIPDIDRGGEEEFNIIRRAINMTNIQIILYYSMAIVLITNRVVYALRNEPLVYDIYDPVSNSTTTVVERSMPWISWVWFDIRPSPNYELAFVWQVWCYSIFGVKIGLLDTLISAMLIHLNAQFQILHNAVLTVLERARKMQDREKDLKLSSNHNEVIDNNVEIFPKKCALNDDGWEEIYDHDDVLKKNFEFCLKNCLEHHIKIIALSDNVEDQFHLMVLVQILGSTLIFVVVLVQLSAMPLFTTRFFSMSLYLILMLFQLAVFCYNGNEITVQSEGIATAAYNCDWFAAENRVKKYIILMMLRAQRPIRMSAGKFVYLSFAMFMTIVRGSMSYYMVLRQKAEESAN